MATKKTIEGVDLFGEKYKYTFNLIDAESGLEILYDLGPKLLKIFAAMQGKKFKIKIVAPMIEEHFSLEQIKELAKKLVSGASIVKGDVVYDAGENGIGDYAEGDPVAIHTAILYSLTANFPKYINPLLDGTESESDSSQSTTKTKPKKQNK